MNTITPLELKAKLDLNEKIHLIDVREPNEHAVFNIGGTLLPLGKVQSMQLEDIEDLRNEPIVVYCRSGMRSMQATMILQQFGFSNVTNLQGGMVEWQESVK